MQVATPYRLAVKYRNLNRIQYGKTSINVRACNIGSAERHNLRSKELDYIRPELTHRNEQWVERSIPEVHQDIAEKYKTTTGQGLQKRQPQSVKVLS